jgi:hypothetical protein
MMRSNGASSSPQPTESSIHHEFRQTMIKAVESSNRTQPREKIGASNVSLPILLPIVRLKTVLGRNAITRSPSPAAAICLRKSQT